MNYYPAPQDAAAERVGQLVIHAATREAYRIDAIPDGGPSHQHYAITGIEEPKRRLRVSVKGFWRDYSPVREG